MGFCNDCGAAVANVKVIGDHYKEAHDGMPRFRYFDEKTGVETQLCADCLVDVTPHVVSTQGETPKTDWDYSVHQQQERIKEARGQGHHGGEK
jgi:hypothetical protein